MMEPKKAMEAPGSMVTKTIMCKSIVSTLLALAVGMAHGMPLHAMQRQSNREMLTKNTVSKKQSANEFHAAALKKVLSVDLQNVTLEQGLKTIAHKAGLKLVYSKNIIPANKKVSLLKSTTTLESALWTLLAGTNLRFGVSSNNHLVIMKRAKEVKKIVRRVQAETITGTVTDGQSGETLPGVNILVKGTTTGTSTDAQGAFELNVESLQDTLVVSFIGYQTREVSIQGRTVIDVALRSQAITGEEMVVIGYGTQQSRDVTGSISSVSEGQLNAGSPTDVFEALSGQMSGVQITSNSGAPGGGSQMRIRGNSTFSGGVKPLYIVDGQPVDNINNLNPNDIASVEVLKDGASAAIYGSKSANGVVLITTKMPEEGTSNLSVNYLRSYSSVRDVPYINTNQWIQYMHKRGHDDLNLNDKRNQSYQVNEYHWDRITRRSKKDELNFGYSSGTENTSFYVNAGFLNEDGVIIGTNYKRMNGRINVNHDFNDRISLSTKVNFTYGLKDKIDPSLNSLIADAISITPIAAYYDHDGSLLTRLDRFETGRNVLRQYSDKGMKFDKTNLSADIFNQLEINLLDNLTYTANLGVGYDNNQNEEFYPPEIAGLDKVVRATYSSGTAWNWIHESFFNYENTFGDHELSGTAGFSLQKWINPTQQISGLLANDLISTLNNIEQINPQETYTLDENDHSLASIFARLNYNYKNKYLLSGTIRRDGSSRFGPENRWGNFPALSIGWRFAEESFMNNLSFISSGKIRASYALTGNERIGNRDYTSLYSIGKFYNGTGAVGLSSRLGNQKVRWEETTQSNVGLDIGFLNERLNINFDYYLKNTDGLLANRLLPLATGVNNARVNVGKVQNEGFEFAIQSTIIERNKLTWNTSFNFSKNTNVVKKMESGTPIRSNTHITREGSAVGSFYGYQMLGVYPYDESNAYTSQGERLTPQFNNNSFVGYTLNGSEYNGNVKQMTVQGVTPGGGDYIYGDNNGDFNIDGRDRIILGNPFPKYYGGFSNKISYKGIQLSVLVGFQFDVEVFDQRHAKGSFGASTSLNPPPYVWENSWKEPGDQAQYAVASETRGYNQLGFSWGGQASNLWVEDADYIKLRNIRLSYEIPLQKLGVGNQKTILSVYSSVNNLMTWTNYRGFDPEVTNSGNPLNSGIDNAVYPHAREFIVGFNIEF